MNNPYSKEKDFMDELELFLIDMGFKTWREVNPDKSRFRIDLIFWNEEVGYIAVEGKNLKTLRQGGKIAKTINQVNKYRNLTFFEGIKINRWCITTPITLPHCISEDIIKMIKLEITIFIRTFLKTMYDIELLEFEKSESGFKSVKINNLGDNSIHISKYGINGGFKKNGDSISEI